MVDVAQLLAPRARERTPVLEACGVAPGGYLLATAHRAGNVDDPARLARLVDAAARAARRRSCCRCTRARARGWRRPGCSTSCGGARRAARPAARLPRLHVAAAARARRADRLRRRAEGGLPRRRAVRDAARHDGVDRDRRRGLERARGPRRARPRWRRWSARRRPSARRCTATAAPASASSQALLALRERAARGSDRARRRRRPRLLGPEPRPQLRRAAGLRARLVLRRLPERARALGAQLPRRALHRRPRRPARRRRARRGRARHAGADPRRAGRARARRRQALLRREAARPAVADAERAVAAAERPAGS